MRRIILAIALIASFYLLAYAIRNGEPLLAVIGGTVLAVCIGILICWALLEAAANALSKWFRSFRVFTNFSVPPPHPRRRY